MKSWEVHPILSDSKKCRVFSPSNIALAKYWGKRDKCLNLPTNGSLSVALKDFGSYTTVEFNQSFKEDVLILNKKQEDPSNLKKVINVLNLVRQISGLKLYAKVQSENNFPTAAGLASSASGLSAVAFAAAKAMSLDIPLTKISEIARQGSGSACRSLFDGFVEWKRGELADGSDSVAEKIADASHLPLKIFIAVSNSHQKDEASTSGMEITKTSSPYFQSWIENAQLQVQQIKCAVLEKNLDALIQLTETNCMRMHASAMAANPPVLYWSASTIDVMKQVWKLRKQGKKVFFTIDAGPNVVVLCDPSSQNEVRGSLKNISGIDILETEIGQGTRELLV